VAEREVDRLRVLLTQATAELDHVKSNIGDDVREQMRTLRSQNKLLHATVGDLEDELLHAKSALTLNGKKGEERLVTQVQLLHRELRMAWMQRERLQLVPQVSAQELDDRLRAEMIKIAKNESEVGTHAPTHPHMLTHIHRNGVRKREGHNITNECSYHSPSLGVWPSYHFPWPFQPPTIGM